MKILICSTNGIKRDGITAWISQHVTQMAPSVHEVDTIAFPGVDRTVVAELEAAGATVHVLPSRKQRPLSYIRSLRQLIRQRDYDVVHINGNSATVVIDLMCCAERGVRNRVVHAHNTTGRFVFIHRLLRPLMNALCTERLACGRDAGEWMFGGRRFDVMPNSREFQRYSFKPNVRTQLRDALDIAPNVTAIGHVGNFSHQKNHQYLIHAFANALEFNGDLRLFLIGDGPLRPHVEDQVRALGLESYVTLLGRCTNVEDYINAFDLAVLPSLHEGFPTVAVEWQINGLPSLLSSAITDEVAVSSLVRFISLDEPRSWSREMAGVQQVDRVAESALAQVLLRSAGFEARESGSRLTSFYCSIA